jgi:hypothetical protein
MASPRALAGRFGLRERRASVPVVPRFLALVRAPNLDAELAEGLLPSTTPAHQLRADHLRRPRVRRRIAAALNRAVAEAGRPVRRGSPEVPLNGDAIRRCRRELLALAASVATLEDPRTQGLAIAFQLAFDGRGALFLQPETRGGLERLANTIQAAHAALRVSAVFDEQLPFCPVAAPLRLPHEKGESNGRQATRGRRR